MTNPYNCPNRVYQAMQHGKLQMLAAVKALGPSRAQWLGNPLKGSTGSRSDDTVPTSWALDGARATKRELMEVRHETHVAG